MRILTNIISEYDNFVHETQQAADSSQNSQPIILYGCSNDMIKTLIESNMIQIVFHSNSAFIIDYNKSLYPTNIEFTRFLLVIFASNNQILNSFSKHYRTNYNGITTYSIVINNNIIEMSIFDDDVKAGFGLRSVIASINKVQLPINNDFGQTQRYMNLNNHYFIYKIANIINNWYNTGHYTGNAIKTFPEKKILPELSELSELEKMLILCSM